VTASKIILASASPRRRQLLAGLGLEFEVVPSSIHENSFPAGGFTPADYAKKLALLKADDVAEKYPANLVIGADTLVDFDGRIIGKPSDEKEAEKITRLLFSKPHKVITALALVKTKLGLRIVEADTTVVYPKKLSDAQIAEHISSRRWQGKAGAYAIRQNDEFIDHIVGSFTNVMGLPTELLQNLLKKIAEASI